VRLWISAIALVALVAWLHSPLVGGGLLGAPGTDVFRAVWGFDHQVRGLPLPFWTSRVGFPAGEKLLILPFVSSLLGAPFHVLFGAWSGYNLWILTLLAGGGVATSWWVFEATRSPSAGLLAGVGMVTQPALFLALTDGTPEHVAFWSLPALLAALWQTAGSPRWRWPLLAGILATVVALDSPYHAIFAVLLVPLALWRCTTVGRLRFGFIALLGAALVALLYYKLPLAGPLDNRWDNAVRLSVWWQWEAGKVSKPWDFSYTPAFIPVLSMVAAVAVALLRPARSGPWLLLGLLCLVLALGGNLENPVALGRWIPGVGEQIGDGIVWFNNQFAPEAIRFPRRWLLPAALCMWTAAGIGLSRLPAEWMRLVVGCVVALGTVWTSLDTTGYRQAFPQFDVPTAAFATFVAEHETAGAALVLPTIRGASRKHERFELPIFAQLDDAIRSADLPYLQVAMGRAVVNEPQGLFTMVAINKQNPGLTRMIQDLNDLCTPQTTGMPIAPSATQEPATRVLVARDIVARGLRFVVLDEEAYGETGIAYARLPFERHIDEEKHFADGTGVRVWVLKP
jgi:hypothetical protein